MAEPIHEDSIEAPNGVRKTFHTAAPYVAMSVRVFLNGQLMHDDDYSLPGMKKVTFPVAPRVGDQITFFYIPAI